MNSGAAASRKPSRIDLTAASLAARIVEAPFLAPDIAASADARLQDWLSQLGPEADGLGQVFSAAPKARELIAGLGEYSPYLWDLVRADPDRILRVLCVNPDSQFRSRIASMIGALTHVEAEA